MENVEPSILSEKEQAKEVELLGTMGDAEKENKAVITVEDKASIITEDSSLIKQDVAETNKIEQSLNDTSLQPLESFAMISHPTHASESLPSEQHGEDSDSYITPRSTIGGQSDSTEVPPVLSEGLLEKEEQIFGEFDDAPRTSSSFDIIGDDEVDDISDEDMQHISNINNLGLLGAKPTSEIPVNSKEIDDLFKYKQMSADDMCKWSTASTCSNDTIAQQKIFMNESHMTEIVDGKSGRVEEPVDNGIGEDELSEEKVNENEIVHTVQIENLNPVEAYHTAVDLSDNTQDPDDSAGILKVANERKLAEDQDVAKQPEIAKDTDVINEPEVANDLSVAKESELAKELHEIAELEIAKQLEVKHSDIVANPEVPKQAEVAEEPEVTEKTGMTIEPELAMSKDPETTEQQTSAKFPDPYRETDVAKDPQAAEEPDVAKVSDATNDLQAANEPDVAEVTEMAKDLEVTQQPAAVNESEVCKDAEMVIESEVSEQAHVTEETQMMIETEAAKTTDNDLEDAKLSEVAAQAKVEENSEAEQQPDVKAHHVVEEQPVVGEQPGVEQQPEVAKEPEVTREIVHSLETESAKEPEVDSQPEPSNEPVASNNFADIAISEFMVTSEVSQDLQVTEAPEATDVPLVAEMMEKDDLSSSPITPLADESEPIQSSSEKTEEVGEEDKDKPGPDGWVEVLGNGSLKKRTKRVGSGENLEKGQQVVMKYTLMLSSGKIVDEDVTQTFQLGDGEVIDAIDLTANLAKVGEIYEAMSQSRFAYGILGRPPHISPNTSILMIVEIIQAEDTLKIADMAEVERITIGDRKRKIGNDHFARHDFARASTNYQGACKYLDPPSYEVSGEASVEMKDLQAKTWCNLALSELKLEKYDSGILAADRALQVDPKSTKALYRKGKLLEEKGELEEAEEVLKQALKIDPSSPGCKQFLKELSQKISNQKKKQQRMYKKMLNLSEEEEEDTQTTSFGERQTSWREGAIPTIAGAVTVGALAAAAYFGLKSFQG